MYSLTWSAITRLRSHCAKFQVQQFSTFKSSKCHAAGTPKDLPRHGVHAAVPFSEEVIQLFAARVWPRL